VVERPLDSQLYDLDGFQRVGGRQEIQIDTRVIAATNADLKQAIVEGKFREDLFYRLHVVPIELPPLRGRGLDIELLARHLVAKICRKMNIPQRTIEPDAFKILASYHWPGNVRELENVIERALVLGTQGTITAGDLPSPAESDLKIELPPSGPLDLTGTIESIERRIISETYNRTKGNKSQTARLLGIKTSVLYYKLKKYGLL
jgi:two-component system response regulator HydG